MLKIDKFLVVNIRRYLDKKEIGENMLIQVLSGFSCPRNLDVERFLKKNAIEFTKKNQSVTYLVFSLDSDNMDLVGYFSIALKRIIFYFKSSKARHDNALPHLYFNRFSIFRLRHPSILLPLC